jgi:hypothetical protein
VSPDQQITLPPRINLPALPIAQPNLQSLANTVNALRNFVLLLAGQHGTPGTQGVQGIRGAPGQNGKTPKGARITEISRQTNVVRIFQDNNKNSPNYVDVLRINRLVMQDKVTGEQWVWDRTGGGNPNNSPDPLTPGEG